MALTKAEFLAFADKLYNDPTVNFQNSPEIDNQECFDKVTPSLSTSCMIQAAAYGPFIAFYSAFATGFLWGIAYKEWIDEREKLENLASL